MIGIIEVLQEHGPISASRLASNLGLQIEEVYLVLVSLEAKQLARVVVEYHEGGNTSRWIANNV